MLSRLLRAGDDGTRGGSTAAGKPLPFYVRETTAGGGGETVVTDHRACFSMKDCVAIRLFLRDAP